MSTSQPKRLSYTRRDLLSLHDDVDRYLKEFIPRIQDTSQVNSGRLFLTIFEALIDNLNFSVDQSHLESILATARQRKNIIRLSYMVGYNPKSTAAASVDATFSMLSGVAGPGGQAIPIYSRLQTTVAPTVEFITTEASAIPEDDTSIVVPAIQGIRVVNEVMTSAASGRPNQSYTIGNARTPHDYIEVRVDGVLVDRVTYFADSDPDTLNYILEFDDNDFTTVNFGDDEYGKSPPNGSQITVSYIQSAGQSGNASAGTIRRVIGSIASVVGVTNVETASGGAASESNESIKRNAPASKRSNDRIVTREDHEVAANQVSGVYSSFAKRQEGALTNVYIMPEGGGVASSFLLSQVQEKFDKEKIEGAVPQAFSLSPADILISVNIVCVSSRVPKSSVRQKVRTATTDSLFYKKLVPGRGFTLSDLANIYENIDSGKLVDYVDFVTLSRVPRVTRSNDASPDFFGRVKLNSNVGYDTYLITALSTTSFAVSKNGSPQSQAGTVATEFTTDESEVVFTIGQSGDVFVPGDTWRFDTSKYKDNLVIGDEEFMRLLQSTDLTVSVFFPNEYNIKTQSAV